jgi:hypothetical protein
MKKLNEKQLEILEGGKFWGSGRVSHFKQCETGVFTYDVCKQKYFFWIKVVDEFACDEHKCPGYL